MTPKVNQGPYKGWDETQISMKMSSFHMFLTVPAEGGPREGVRGRVNLPQLQVLDTQTQGSTDFLSHFGSLGVGLGVHFGVPGAPGRAKCLPGTPSKPAKVEKKLCLLACRPKSSKKYASGYDFLTILECFFNAFVICFQALI